jgi:DNA-binding CsgD family transcriptional regulator
MAMTVKPAYCARMGRNIIGREAELSVLERFLASLSSGAGALVLAGPAGAGKTTLIRAGQERAAAAGYTVLRSFPSPSDLRLAFAGLADLLSARIDEVLPGLPPPQRRALGAALVIEEALETSPEPNVIAAAVRQALVMLAARAPVLIVVDDVQWLDPPSASAVSFAARRLDTEHIGLLCAVRTEEPHDSLPLELNRASVTADVLPIGGLSQGALHRLLRTELELSLSQPTLHRVHAESAGNPFVALEIGRALARRGITRIGSGPLPVPSTLGGLLGERLDALPRSVVSALAVLAVMPDAPVGRLLAAGVPGDDLDAAVLAGVVEANGERLRFAHPLLASAVLGSVPPARRRALHALAAQSTADPEERARHKALADDAKSAQLAAELEDAARTAERRGAPTVASELLELAASRTPDGQDDDAHRRLLRAGRLLSIAGEGRAAVSVFSQLAADAPAGPRHAEAIAHLAWTSEDDIEHSTNLLEQALAEAADSPALTARIGSFLSDYWAMRGDPVKARAAAYRALEHAERADDEALLAALLAHAFICDWRCGYEADESQLARAMELERGHAMLSENELEPPRQVAGLYLSSVGRLDEARAVLEGTLAEAQAQGMEYVRADVLLRLSVLASRTGDPRRGAELAREGLEIAEQLDLGQLTSAQLYGCGFAALYLGLPDEVAEIAGRGQELSFKVGDRVYLRAHDAICGAVDVARGNYAAAAARLRPLISHRSELGRRFESFWVPEIAEALIGVGDIDEAAVLAADLQERFHDPVTRAAAARCRGLLSAACGRLEDAVAELRQAQELRSQVTPEPLTDGRILLALGTVQRRLNQRRAARETLEAAITTFDLASARLWANRSRQELARVSGRPPGTGGLTGTERRVAELVASGMTNRAVAAELFVTVRAVEATLTKVYAKLGVGSRTQLTGRLSGGA